MTLYRVVYDTVSTARLLSSSSSSEWALDDVYGTVSESRWTLNDVCRASSGSIRTLDSETVDYHTILCPHVARITRPPVILSRVPISMTPRNVVIPPSPLEAAKPAGDAESAAPLHDGQARLIAKD